LNITGKWSQEHKPHGYQYVAQPFGHGGQRSRKQRTQFGPVSRGVNLMVHYGMMPTGQTYLNFRSGNLAKVGLPVGGILGLDDHTEASSIERCLQDQK